jgi:ATP-dependent Clp protease protease subunit
MILLWTSPDMFAKRVYSFVCSLALAGTLANAQAPTAPPTPPKTTVIRFYAPVNELTVAQLLNNIDQKMKTGTKRFVLLISSPGGSVFAGLSAYHYLKGIPAEVETHNFGEVDSIATVIYCAGSKRYSVPQGRFLLHSVTANFAPNVPFDDGAVNEQLKLMQQQVNSIASVIAETVRKPEADVQKLIAQHTVYSATEAQTFGLVTDIREKLYDEGADLISIGETQLPDRGDRLSVTSPKENSYTTNIDLVSTVLKDFSTRLPDFNTSSEDSLTVPVDRLWVIRGSQSPAPSPE